jgi:hypothetical protein
VGFERAANAVELRARLRLRTTPPMIPAAALWRVVVAMVSPLCG